MRNAKLTVAMQYSAQISRLQQEVESLRKDAARLDWLEALTEEGHAPAVVFDDDGRWAVTCDGSSPVPEEGGFKEEVEVVSLVKPETWRDSIRAAIDSAMEKK